MTELEKQPFTAHLEELRSRLIKSFIAVTIGFLASYFFKEQIFQILTMPLVKVMKAGDHLIYTNPPEAFFTFLKAAFISGIMIASPSSLSILDVRRPGPLRQREAIGVAHFGALNLVLLGFYAVIPFSILLTRRKIFTE